VTPPDHFEIIPRPPLGQTSTELARASAAMGKLMVNRLAIYPAPMPARPTLARSSRNQVRPDERRRGTLSEHEEGRRQYRAEQASREWPSTEGGRCREIAPHRRSRDAGQRLDSSEIMRLLRRAMPELPPRHRRGQCAAPGGQRRRRRYVAPQHQIPPTSDIFRCRFCAGMKRWPNAKRTCAARRAYD